MTDFARYVALGDSMSIDLYPALDAGSTDVAVALERVPSAGDVAPLGAASLLYKNVEELWPDETGNDLSSSFPGMLFENLATDGATIGDVFGDQILRLEESDLPTIVTLTVGGNDLLSGLGNRPRREVLDAIVHDVIEAYDFLVDLLRGRLAHSTLIVTTVYDPSDGSGQDPRRARRRRKASAGSARPFQRPRARDGDRHAARASRRRARALSGARRVRGRSRSVVLATVAG